MSMCRSAVHGGALTHTYNKRGKFPGDPQNLRGKFRGQFKTRNFPHEIIPP